MAQTRLDVVNLGISKAGGEKVASLEENTPLAMLAREDYPQVTALMLSKHRWVFAKVVARLTQLATAPAGCPRTYAYQRPVGLVGNVHDYRSGPRDDAAKVSCLQMSDHIASDAAEVWVEYTANRGEETWPPWFVDVVVCAFAEVVANAKQRRLRAQELRIELYGNPEDRGEGGLIGLAKAADSHDAPKRTLEWEGGGALVEARVAGGYGLNDSRLAQALLYRSIG